MVSKTVRRTRLLAGLCLTSLLLGGCMPKQSAALIQDKPATLSTAAQIKDVTFFPQQDYQCGPAAMGMAMGHAGVEVSPEQLRPKLYIPGKQGSLQIEMMAIPRRYGLLAYPLKPQIGSILHEIKAGHPVVVFQNLGLSMAPQWHYAVATGFDLARGEVTLHSGNTPNYTLALATFERTWVRAESWAMVVLPAGQLPADAEMKTYLKAAITLEQVGFTKAALKSYQAALTLWPENLTAWMGAGNCYYALGKLDSAADAFMQASRFHPEAATALNNLAQIRLDQGHYKQAKVIIERAIQLNPESTFLQHTRTNIERSPAL